MGRLRTFWKGLLAGGAAGAGVAALAAFNAAVAREVPEPETGALGGEAGTFQWKHGQIFYRHAGREDAPPVLFVHGIGAGARAFMWRRNFLPLARDFRSEERRVGKQARARSPPRAPENHPAGQP